MRTLADVTRWIGIACAMVAGLAMGVAMMWSGMRADAANHPTELASYAIVSRYEGEAKRFDFVRDGQVAYTLSGSLDTLCDEPALTLLDIDRDGDTDLLFRSCNHFGYLTHRGGTFEFIDLDRADPSHPDAPGLHTLWAWQVRHGGWPLLLGGAVFIFAVLAAGMSRVIASAD
jgi:hypothetical protein